MMPYLCILRHKLGSQSETPVYPPNLSTELVKYSPIDRGVFSSNSLHARSGEPDISKRNNWMLFNDRRSWIL